MWGQTAFTISTTGSAGGPTELQGQWEFRTQTPNPIAGEVVYDGTALVGEIDTWRFNTGTGYADARTELLDLASGDMVEISQTASRHQTITVTSTPTISGNIVTVSGRADRALSGQIPGSGQGVTVTLIPGPIQGVDQTARDSVTDHEGTAHNTDTMARETAMRASDKVDTHVLNHPMGTDTTARASAAAAQADIDDHEANHPGGGDGGAFVLGNVADGRLPLPPVTMRIAWIESGDVVTSATFGPLASVGDTTQTRAPDFPQAYLDDGLGAAVIVFWSATTGLVPLVYPLDRYEIVSGPGTVLNVDGEHGTYWTTDVVFSRHAEGDRFSLQFPGELIATESWVEEQIDAIPGGGGGGGGTSAAWDWLGHVSGGAWLAGTARTVGYRPFPVGGYADYAALRAAIVDGTISQIAVRISQNDSDDVDDDHGTSVHPNIEGFYRSAGTWRVFPGHALNVDPVGFTITFGAADLTIAADTSISGTNTVIVRVAIWA